MQQQEKEKKDTEELLMQQDDIEKKFQNKKNMLQENPGEEEYFNYILQHGIKGYAEIEIGTIKTMFENCTEF